MYLQPNLLAVVGAEPAQFIQRLANLLYCLYLSLSVMKILPAVKRQPDDIRPNAEIFLSCSNSSTDEATLLVDIFSGALTLIHHPFSQNYIG